jgi:transposase InsO family protein
MGRDNAPKDRQRQHLERKKQGRRARCDRTRAAAEADLFDYIEPFYNRRRQHSTLGYASPMKFLEDWVSTQHERQLAA